MNELACDTQTRESVKETTDAAVRHPKSIMFEANALTKVSEVDEIRWQRGGRLKPQYSATFHNADLTQLESDLCVRSIRNETNNVIHCRLTRRLKATETPGL